jgi:coenzyme F420-reducing hydrogenase alpha subunit
VHVRAGTGSGAVEVPRGILFHEYTYDDKGICRKANCVIPTNQNHNNIQKDFEAFAPTLLDKPLKEIELNLEMLVRAYDPCISCSTHYLNVKFVR